MRYMTKRRAWLAFLVLTVLLVACSSPIQRRYYTLSATIGESVAKSAYPVDVWVKEVEVAPVYNRPQIVYRYTPNELQYYNLQNWADRPSRMVTQMMLQSLGDSGLFRSVVERLGLTQPTYVLESSVQALEELDGGDVWFAHLAMQMRLSRFEDNKVVWQYSFDERRPLSRQDLGLVVRAVSDIFQEEMRFALTQMDAVLGGRPLPQRIPKPSVKQSQAVDPGAMVIEPQTGEQRGTAGKRGKGAKAAPPKERVKTLPAETTDSSGVAPVDGQGASGGAAGGAAGTGGGQGADAVQPNPPTGVQAAAGTPGAVSPGGQGAGAAGPGPSADAARETAPGTLPSDDGPPETGSRIRTVKEGMTGRTGDVDPRARDWSRSAQFYSDETIVPPGKGAVFLPALSAEPDREPPVEVYRDGRLVASGTTGRRIPVAPGAYQVYFGSGALSQRMVRGVTVEEGVVTVVQPDWATLDISVVNERFIPFRGNYELIRMRDREYMGVGYGADEELGEETSIWLLRPGLYKIIQTGGTYRARTNFATVELNPADPVNFVLVQDENSRDFLGAGVTGDELRNENEGRWSLRSSIGGSVFLTDRSSGFSAQEGSSLALELYSDNLFRFREGPHLWSTRLELEEGGSLQSTLTETDESAGLLNDPIQTLQSDRLYLNSIYMYELLRWAGPYVRVGGETSLFTHNQEFADPTTVEIQDADGNFQELQRSIDRLTLSKPFSPLQLKQGAGVNFRLLHNTVLDLDLRVGAGSRQYLTRGVPLLVATDPTERDPDTGELIAQVAYKSVRNSVVAGPEATLLASGRFTRYLQVTTELDMLTPLAGVSETQFTWRSSATLRLSTYASLTYTLNLDRHPDVRPEQPLAFEHGLQLRFFYSPF